MFFLGEEANPLNEEPLPRGKRHWLGVVGAYTCPSFITVFLMAVVSFGIWLFYSPLAEVSPLGAVALGLWVFWTLLKVYINLAAIIYYQK
ncbi:unnamed protein product, partial [Mesorhabditis spiculigera]